MSKYTTEVRYICENAAGLKSSVGYNDVDNIITLAIPKIFNFTFPIFDDIYRNVLCSKILKHYYTREIGEETVGLWKLRLETRLNEIMPYYNKLYKSELLEFNPLHDVELTTENTATKTENRDTTDNETENKSGTSNKNRDLKDNATTENTGETTANNTTTTDETNIRTDLYSDTPQGALTNLDNGEYLTNARRVSENKNETKTDEATGNSTNNTTYSDSIVEKSDEEFNEDITRNKTGTENINTTDKYIHTITGKTGGMSYSKMIEEFRKTFLNIDMMVINELSDLFMCIW